MCIRDRIKSLEERLRTRFEWGLTADVQPPDFETRVASVKRKAELLHRDLPEDVAEFIANHLKNNIRQLEGAVKKLNAYYMLELSLIHILLGLQGMLPMASRLMVNTAVLAPSVAAA